MRSVYVFIPTTVKELRSHLDSLTPRVRDVNQWLYPNATEKVLYIEIADDVHDELEPETAETLLRQFGGERVRCVSIDVSSRCPGEHEIREIVLGLLHRFGGVAMDDWSDHLWTLDEIKTGLRCEGRHFFTGD